MSVAREEPAWGGGRKFAWALCVLGGLVLPAAGLVGCGYSTQEVFPAEVASVAVPIPENRTFYHGVEFEIGEAIVKEIQSRTPYKVIPEASADTILETEVVAVDQRQLSRRRKGGVPQEVEVQMLLNVRWRDARSGEVLVEREGLAVTGHYLPSRPAGEPFEVAQHELAASAAQRVVSAMRWDW